MKGDSCKYRKVLVPEKHKPVLLLRFQRHGLNLSQCGRRYGSPLPAAPVNGTLVYCEAVSHGIHTRLTAFDLLTVGTKRTLAARLLAHLQTLPAPPESPASTGDGSDHGSATPSDALGESSRHRHHAAGEKERHGRHATGAAADADMATGDQAGKTPSQYGCHSVQSSPPGSVPPDSIH